MDRQGPYFHVAHILVHRGVKEQDEQDNDLKKKKSRKDHSEDTF